MAQLAVNRVKEEGEGHRLFESLQVLFITVPD